MTYGIPETQVESGVEPSPARTKLSWKQARMIASLLTSTILTPRRRRPKLDNISLRRPSGYARNCRVINFLYGVQIYRTQYHR